MQEQDNLSIEKLIKICPYPIRLVLFFISSLYRMLFSSLTTGIFMRCNKVSRKTLHYLGWPLLFLLLYIPIWKDTESLLSNRNFHLAKHTSVNAKIIYIYIYILFQSHNVANHKIIEPSNHRSIGWLRLQAVLKNI